MPSNFVRRGESGNPEYWGVFLDNASRETLEHYFLSVIPSDWKKFIDHVTVAYRKPIKPETVEFINEMIAEPRPVSLRVVSLGISQNAIAVGVEGDFVTDNKHSHITLAVPPGGKPVNSNYITDWQPIDEDIELAGTFDTRPSGLLKPIAVDTDTSILSDTPREFGGNMNGTMMEARDGKGVQYETLKELAVWLLSVSSVLNVFHWNSSKNNKHELLNEAYDLCRDTADKLGETYISKTGKKISGKMANESMKDLNPDDEHIIKYLESISSSMNGAVEKNPKFTEGIKNIFADFDEKMTSILYKYRQFAS